MAAVGAVLVVQHQQQQGWWNCWQKSYKTITAFYTYQQQWPHVFWTTLYLTIDNNILSYSPSVTVKINCCNVCRHLYTTTTFCRTGRLWQWTSTAVMSVITFWLHVKYLSVVLLQVRVVRFNVQRSTCVVLLPDVSYLLPFIFSNCHDVCDDKV